MKMFDAGRATRALVITTQVVMTPALMLMYAIRPKAVHRFVGYLEETACHTYSNVIKHCEIPGTKLHTVRFEPLHVRCSLSADMT